MNVKIVLLIMIGIILAVSAEAEADNVGEIDDYRLMSFDFLLVEIDFTEGESVWIDIKVQSNKTIDIIMMPQDSLGPLIGGGFRWAISDYSYFNTVSLDQHFIMSNDRFPNMVYYYFIEPPPYESIRVTIKYKALVDYDGDGLYGKQDDAPFVNSMWSSNVSGRIEHLENLSGISSDNIRLLQDSILSLSTNVTQYQKHVDDEFATMRATIQINLDYLLDIMDNVLNLHLDLEDGIFEYHNSVNLSLLDMRSELTDLAEEIATVDSGLQKDLQRLNDRLDELEERLGTVEQQILDLEKNQEDQYTELRTAIDNLDVRESTDILQTGQSVDDNHDAAISAANDARNIGVVVGLIGIVLAAICLLLIRRLTEERKD